jgi:enoyl-CoA hydratase/carnithine racemase
MTIQKEKPVAEQNLVLCEVNDYVATVVLNDPDSRNSLSDALVPLLCDILEECDRRTDVSVILLSAAGDSFCAGGNIKEFLTFRDRSAVTLLDDARAGTGRLFHVLASLKTPVVSAVQGPALGGGCGMVCSSSYVFASPDARFGTTEIRLGLFPLVILPAVRKAVGERNAFEMAMTGGIYSAERAMELGMVDRVVAAEDLMKEATAFCRSIADRSPLAVGLGYSSMRETENMGVHEAVDYLASIRVAFYQSEDVHEGAASFLERRDPSWTGR